MKNYREHLLESLFVYIRDCDGIWAYGWVYLHLWL
jgi:hypothetical protein